MTSKHNARTESAQATPPAAPARRRRRFPIPARIYARLAVYFIACWSMVGLLAHDVVPFSLLITVALALYTTLPLAVFLGAGGWPAYPSAAVRLWIMRPFWYAQLTLPLVTIAGLVGLAAGSAIGQPVLGGRAFAAVVGAGMLGLFVAGYIGSRRLVIHELDVSIPTLPRAFDGLTIAHISDLHVGPQIPSRRLHRIRNTLDRLAPDVIVVNGDLVDDRWEDVATYAAAFSGLAAPLGVFITPGNHEIYSGWDAVERELVARGLGVLLVNESRALERHGNALHIVGIGDPAAQHDAPRAAPDVERALANVPPDATVVAFVHNPLLWPVLAEYGVSLTLSGHTHWGQFALPRFGWSLASPFLAHAMGAYRRDDAMLYISPGTGYFGIPFRIGAPGEIALVRLRRGPTEMIDEGRINARS
jgi:predicted MPP superfamily phosphohydrolase